MPQPLGYRGRQVLTYIETTVSRKGHAPSYTDIADHFGMERSDVCNCIRRLENRGMLKRRTVGVRKNRGWHSPVIVLMRRTQTT